MIHETTTSALLSLQDLATYFYAPGGVVKAVDGVSLDLAEGETLGIVGESGSGKSATCLSILGLIPPPGRIVRGKVLFEGRDLCALPERELRTVRGQRIGMVFQDPMTSLNPFLTIGDQLAETLLVHGSAGRAEAWRKAAEMLDKVGIADAGARMRDYPHHFSGGMRQRVMIAMALLGHPKVLIADEPTTALDATIQAQVLDLFQQIKQEYGTALLLVTHNLGIVAGMADRIAVMYAGRVVEYGSADDIFYRPRHPYTLALLRAVPRLGGGTRDGSHEGAHGEEHEGMHEGMHDVTPIPGAPPDLAHLPVGCAFYDRCPFHEEQCLREMPPLVPVGAGHMARCWVDVRGREPAGGPDAGREEPEAR